MMKDNKKFNIYDYVDHVMCINYINNGRFEHLKKELKYIGTKVNDIDKCTFVYSYDKDFPIYNVIAEEYKKIYYLQTQKLLPYSNLFDKHAFDVTLTHYKAFKIALAKGWDRVLILEDDIHMLKDINKIQEIFKDIDFSNDLIILDPSAQHSMIYAKNLLEVKDKFNIYTFIKSATKYFYNITADKAIDFFSAAFNIYNRKAMEVYVDLWENKFMFSCDEYYALSLGKEILNIGVARYPVCQTDVEMKDNLIRKFFINDLTNDSFRK